MSDKRPTSDNSQSESSSESVFDQSEMAANASQFQNNSSQANNYTSPFNDQPNSASESAVSDDYETSNGNYLDKISSNANATEVYFHQIDSVSSDMVKNSAGINSEFAKMNLLNTQTGLNGVTLSDNQMVNNATQAIAIDMIKVNNQKIKALAAKNRISGMSFKVRLDYNNYLKAQKAIEDDVTGINSHMGNSSAAFGQGINTLNSHNSLVTSYANQLSLDIDNADKEVSNASTAASLADLSRMSASSAYYGVSSLVSRFQQKVVGTAHSNAGVVSQMADKASGMVDAANSYSDQVASVASEYSNNSDIASASSAVNDGLSNVNASHKALSSMASSVSTRVEKINPNNINSLGADFRDVQSAAKSAANYQGSLDSANQQITSAASAASTIAHQLHAKRVALKDGANAYTPVVGEPSVNPDENTDTYIKYYKLGYQKASQGFSNHLRQVVAGHNANGKKSGLAYRVGFKNAGYFIKGVNDARKRVIKNSQLINTKHYNFGYNSYCDLIHNDAVLNHRPTLPLNQSLLLVMGFLVGYNS